MVRKKVNEIKTPAEQQEILDKPINPTGAGEDPAIQDLMSDKFISMNDEDAMSIAIAIAKIVRGQLKEELDGSMAKMKETIIKMENTAKRYEEDRLKFAEDIARQAEKLKKTGTEKVVTEVESAKLMEHAYAEARAIKAQRDFEIQQKALNAPKIKFAHPGDTRTVKRGDEKITIKIPHTISYGPLKYVCQPDEIVELPDFVYEEYLRFQELHKKRNQLNQVLKENKHFGKAIEVAPEVDPEYGAHIMDSVNRQGISTL